MRTDQTISARYRYTRGASEFVVPFPIFEPSDVAVYVSEDGGITERKLSLGVDYDVSIDARGDSGRVILRSNVVHVGATIALLSAIPYVQELDLEGVSTIDTAATETQLDMDCQQRQQLAEGLARSVRVPITSGKTPDEFMRELMEAVQAVRCAEDTLTAIANSACKCALSSAESAEASAESAAVSTGIVRSMTGYSELAARVETIAAAADSAAEQAEEASQAVVTAVAGKQDVISDLAAIRSGAALGATSVQDVSGKQDVITDLASIRSGAAAGATALQSHQDISGKQDVISDLDAIRSGAALGATALQEHQSLDGYLPTTGGAISGALDVSGRISTSSMPYVRGHMTVSSILPEDSRFSSAGFRAMQYWYSYRDTAGQSGVVLSRWRDQNAQGSTASSSLSFHLVENNAEIAGVKIAYSSSGASFVPGKDNNESCGRSDLRWSTVYAGTGTISTSDERVKCDVEDIPEAALRAWGRVQFRRFRFVDSVERKGDGARWHVGLIAQRVKEAFEAEGLDATRYGLLCHDAWTEDNGTEHDLWSIRYEEALAFECAYLRAKLEGGI